MEKMLTRQNVITESPHVETIPINFVATEDGRTLLALTEHKDDMLEIVATPVMLVGQSGTATSLIDVKNLNGNLILHSPVFQISVENIVNESELQQSTQILEPDSSNDVDQIKLQSCRELTFKKTDTQEYQSLSLNDLIDGEKDERSSKEKPINPVAKRNNSGRPKKSKAISSISSQDTSSFVCDICHQEFGKQTLYRKHMESHAEEKPHRCPKCSASFNVPTNFTLHMATHNTGEPKCPECGKKFARMASLKSHMLLHEKEENLFCTECEDAFSTKTQLDAHLKLHGEKWAIEEVRKCKLCNKQFSQPALYRLHIREHYRLQTKVVKQTKRGTKHKTMYKCTICLKSFQKPSQLMRHIRVHTGEKPFKCTICGRAFTQKSSLQIHTWQHNGIRPHACEFCNAKFSQKGNLNAHIMRVHNVPDGEPIYGCNYCSCVFKKLGSLNGHMKRMHTDLNEENAVKNNAHSSDNVESDIRATVNNVITQLASLESNVRQPTDSSNFESRLSSENTTKKDILQQALRNSGLPSKNKTFASEGIPEAKKFGARINFVTLLDRAPDGDTRKYLTIKQRCVGNVKWYACTFCHKEFKKPSDLIRHLRVHTQEKPFKCTYCHRSFALKSTMIAHERTHSSVKRYACGSCDKTFVCHSSLIAHTRLHAKSDNCFDKTIDNEKDSDTHVTIETDVCSGNQSKTQTKGKSKLSPEAESLVPQVILQEPLVISDTGNKISVAPSVGKKKHACDDTAADQARPHKCWICQAAFRKISHLKQHHRRHTGERPYKCTTCDRRFTSNSVLKSHLHTHEDSRPYGCSVCNAKFSTQSSMKRHLVTHSNKRPFMCPYCHKTFKTYVNCRKHMKIHKHELAQRQLEQQKMRIQEQASDKLNTKESPKQEAALESSSSSSVSVTTINSTITTNISITTTASINTTSPIVTTPSSTFSDNLALSRLGSVELSFQPQLGSEFSQAFSEFQNITEEKEKIRPVLQTNCDAAAFINQNVGGIAVTNLENSPILQADEAGSVTLPVYSGDQTLTPESIREIEETLNQQFFNIGMNFNLGGSNHSRHSNSANTSDFGHMKEQQQQQQQQPVLNVIYENNNNNNNNNSNSNGNSNVETSGEHVFPAQLDSFEMDHITLQSDGEIDIGLDTRNSTSMASILPRSMRDERRLSVCVATPDNINVEQSAKSGVQAVVFVSQSNFSKKENVANEFAVEEDTQKNNIHEECTINQIFFTEDLRGTAQDSKVQSNMHALSSNVGEMVETATSKISCEQSLLQCHMCSQQGFTTVGLKEHLTSHRGTKEYQCTECSSKFYTNGGLNRHSKIHVVKQSLKCSSCEKQFNNRVELRSHNKIHETSMWNASGTNGNADNSDMHRSRVVNSHSRTSDVAMESDSAVSEKVLLDTVAEREVMNQVENIFVGKKERKEYTNKCKYCPKTFRKPSDLVRHVRTHTGERPYKCDYCSKSFAVKCTLDSHTKVHTGKKTFRCHVCNSLFATKGSLKVHMRLHTGSKPFRCPICDSRFRTSGHRKVHLLKHAREHKDNAKRKQKHLKVAVIAEVAADLEKCENEKEREMDSFEGGQQQLAQEEQQQLSQTVAINGLTSHLETYSIETATSCLTDQINFDAEAIVSSNNQTIVSINESNQLVTNLHFLLTNGLVTIQTEESLLSQTSASSVNNSHHRPVEVADAGCALLSTSSVVVSDTSEQHAKEEIHIEQMLKTPSNNCLLTVSTVTPPPLEQRSKVTATEETSLPVVADKPTMKRNLSKKECDICGKTFTKPYQVERHKRIHTGERPYKCDLCTKSFAQKSTLQMHQKHHTGDRPYACPYCEYSFTQKGNLRTHVKRVHQLDTVDARRWKRGRQSFLSKTSFQENTIEDKSLNLDSISFVELLK